jgi:glycosyltransferase involved in cell wall biosynthesis
MKILIYSPVFYPMVGGMETVTECMADLFTKEGHQCEVVTPIKHSQEDRYAFKVHRAPGLLQKIRLILWADIVYSNGATLALVPLVKILRKPYAWTHAGYQASCIDGLGWVDGEPAPIDPIGSIKYHWKKSGLFYTMAGAFKLRIRRFVANHLVDLNIAITDWVARRQPFKRQIKIYNPSPLDRFRAPSKIIKIEYDFVYLGRLVSEKGVSTLLNALHLLNSKKGEGIRKLLIIGDGDLREELEEISRSLGIAEVVTFVGKKSGQELTDLIHSARIAVIPSEWEEPMGIVALELMAAGRNIIVSENGGLKECAGEAGLKFPNGDAKALCECMHQLISNADLAEKKRAIGQLQIQKFEPLILVRQYLSAFNSIVKK